MRRKCAARQICGVAATLATLVSCVEHPAAVGGTEEPRSPVRGGVLALIQEAPASLDPLRGDSVYEALPLNQLFDGLVALDSSLHVAPALASSWRISRKGRVYVLNLRDDVRFHDGTPLTSADVVFTFRRTLRPGDGYRNMAFSYLSVVQGAEEFARGDRDDLPGVEALDPHTVRIRLKRPYPSFLEVLALDGLRIVPQHVVEALGAEEFGRRPVGTGPFRLGSWDRSGLRLVANPEYFRGAPHLDAVDLLVFREDDRDGGAARYFSGELDVLGTSSEHLDRLTRDPETRVFRYQELSLAFLGLNAASAPLDDPRVRQAIAHAIDRDALVRESRATRREATGILPPGLWGYSPGPKALRFDRGRARQLLLEAGVADGQGLPTIELIIPSTSETAGQLADRVVADLAEVGISMSVNRVSWSELSRLTLERRAQSFLLAWIADLTDPDSFLRTLFESGGSANYFAFANPRTDELLRLGAAEMNPVERARIYREVERQILDLAPIVPLYHTLGNLAMRRHVHGFEPGPLGIANVNLERVWLDRRGDS